MDLKYEDMLMKQLEDKMNEYRNQLCNRYYRANSNSKKRQISKELIDFAYVYKKIFGDFDILEWENNEEIYHNYKKFNYDTLVNFINIVNRYNDFYSKLSDSVIDSFEIVKYPFYKYANESAFNLPKLSNVEMTDILLSFLSEFDYDNYLLLRDKIINLEVLEVELDSNLGEAIQIYNLDKNFILLNNSLKNNLLKYETIAHEYGHIFEMQINQNSNNLILGTKTYQSPYSEVSSCFFQYSFLNYLKDNKIYPEYTLKCFDSYFKDIIYNMFLINLVTRNLDLEVDEYEYFVIDDKDLINHGDKIKDRLNYYSFAEYNEEINFRYPYIYGVGGLFGIYLYENYKENKNFLSEFRKILSSYQFNSDISVFDKVGINEEKLLKGDVFTKVLKKHCEDFK